MSRTVTLKGDPLEVDGPELKVGDKVPEATLRPDLGKEMKISETSGAKRIFSVVPSLDTSVCAEQTKRFNDEVGALGDVTIYTISCDLPVAQSRFCGAEGIDSDRMKMLSDHMNTEFGKAYGTLIPALRIMCRAVFVVDADDTIRYVEYVPEVAEHPNYDAILECAKSL